MNKAEFNEIFREYFPALCLYAQSIVENGPVAEDLVEEVFIRIWQSESESSTITNFRPYLYQATRHSCFNYLKTAFKTVRLGELQEQCYSDSSEEMDTAMVKTEVYRQLFNALEQLPEKCGKIITMAYLENMSSKQIAGQLGISVSTVDNQKARGLMLMRRLLSKNLFGLLLSMAWI